MIDRPSMTLSRSNTALTLINDRFIFAIGGLVTKTIPTSRVECYDIKTNFWHTIQPLYHARSGATACCLRNRYIYVFPGREQ